MVIVLLVLILFALLFPGLLRALVVLALLAGGGVVYGAAQAAPSLADIEVTPGIVSPSPIATSATFSARNKGTTPVKWLYVQCAILNESGVPKAAEENSMQNIEPGQTAYGSMNFLHTKEGGMLVCRPSEVK